MFKGLSKAKEAMSRSVEQLKMKPGESKVIRIITPADEIISVYEHTEQFDGSWKTVTCLGKNDCPLCQAGKRASMKAYLEVVDRDDSRTKLFKASKKVVMQLIGMVEEYGDVTGRDFKIIRTGEKLETAYQFFPRDAKIEDLSKYDRLNIEETVKALPREHVIAMMNNAMLPVAASDTSSVEEHPFF